MNREIKERKTESPEIDQKTCGNLICDKFNMV